MHRTISEQELRNDSGAIMRAVEAGESFVVTRNGVPLARLTPLEKRTEVPVEEILAALRGAPRIDFARFRADIDDVLDPWID